MPDHTRADQSPEWLSDPHSIRSTLEGLHAAGIQFVLLDGFDAPVPKKASRVGWQKHRPSVRECADHLASGGQLGWIPQSLGCIVIDVDGPQGDRPPWTPERIDELVGRVRAHMGHQGFVAQFPSDSGYRKGTGKQHLIYRFPPETKDAPLGMNPNTDAPYQRHSETRFQDDEDSHFDVISATLVMGTHYFPELLEAQSLPVSGYNSKIAGLIDFGLQYKPKCEIVQFPSVNPLPPSGSAMTPKRKEALIRHFWASPKNVLASGSRHHTLLRWGNYAGHARGWWPEARAEMRAHAVAAGVPESKIRKSFDKGYQNACRVPPSDPPDRPNPNWERVMSACRTPEPPPRSPEDEPPLESYAAEFDAPDGDDGTDYGETTRFVFPREGKLVYRPHLKQWMRFIDDQGWVKRDEEEIANEISRHLAKRTQTFKDQAAALEEQAAALKKTKDATPEDKRKAAKLESIAKRNHALAKALQSKSKRTAVLSLARSHVSMPWEAPFSEAPYLIGLPEGMVYDARSRETRKQKPADRITMSLKVTPDASRGMKHWTQYLMDTFGDLATIKWISRFMGYSMLGYTREHQFAFLQGSPRTGKSTMLFVLMHVFGTYHRPISSRTFMAGVSEQHPTILANLDGPRVVSFSETKRAGKLNEELLCGVVAGDQQSARKMHKDFYDFIPVCKLWFASPHYPQHQGKTSGLAKRVRLIKFENVRPDDQQDEKLPEKLQAEAPGIAAQLLDQASLYLEEGLLPPPPRILAETAEYVEQGDLLADWAESNLEFGEDMEARGPALYADYKDWCAANKIDPVRVQTFTAAVVSDFAEHRVKYCKHLPRAGRNKRGFTGLAIKPKSQRFDDGDPTIEDDQVPHDHLQ